MSRLTKETEKTYGLLWKESGSESPQKWHFNAMQEVIGEPIVRGLIGVEVGSGCGYDAYIMAKNNPSVKFVCIDISEGIYKTKDICRPLGNVNPIMGSALEIPIKDNVFDFAYSFGVLHHTEDPGRGLLEISRILKKDSPAFLYLYEDHSENPLKLFALKIISAIRTITVRIPPKAIYVLSRTMSPFIFLIFTVPSKILGKFKATKDIAGYIPFNFGTGPFSLAGDIYDRFRAPIELRFSRQDVYKMFSKCGFGKVNITRLKDTAGWVAWGYKNR